MMYKRKTYFFSKTPLPIYLLLKCMAIPYLVFGNCCLQLDFAVIFKVNDSKYQNILLIPILLIFHPASFEYIASRMSLCTSVNVCIQLRNVTADVCISAL